VPDLGTAAWRATRGEMTHYPRRSEGPACLALLGSNETSRNGHAQLSSLATRPCRTVPADTVCRDGWDCSQTVGGGVRGKSGTSAVRRCLPREALSRERRRTQVASAARFSRFGKPWGLAGLNLGGETYPGEVSQIELTVDQHCRSRGPGRPTEGSSTLVPTRSPRSGRRSRGVRSLVWSPD